MTAPAAPVGSSVRAALPAALVCAGCGHRVPDAVAFLARCPQAVDGDDVDHVLRRVLDPGAIASPFGIDADDRLADGSSTFIRHRRLIRAYHVARAAGWSDDRFVDLVRRLDEAVAAVDGHGFRETPFEPSRELGRRLGMTGGSLWVKDETGNVAGSHKARHLMGVMLELLVSEGVAAAPTTPRRLAIASCGNAALAAAVVARAARWPLEIFVPTWADEPIVSRLRDLGARVVACPRSPGETGDPTYRRLRSAVAAGAIPFTCQGNENGLAIEGGETLGYEMVERLARTDASAPVGVDARPARLDAVVVQVGGGALASAVAAALAEARDFGAIDREPRLYAVQTAGCAPLAGAWAAFRERVAAEGSEQALEHARRHRSAYMRPWAAEPASAAHGILDDETYDWLAIVEAMTRTGGEVVVVDEPTILAANEVGRAATAIDADHTGTAGLAGLLTLLRSGAVRPDETVAVLFTGVRRHRDRAGAAVAATAAPRRPMETSTR
jgi:threonine synthase